ncbi:ATP-binding protein [Microtetraspora sp. NBRC 16547]|uniref:ATP-binding protein n=1 Tax=Microtetraspora sp. NBRC 16547 TaxID=3030993 RepID=UPI0024A081FC|nr:ATP-binding protein [Microtetraspora sp. NBRC 16547]GLW98252.1 putative magnesium chelatase [Microtetraspora sp. NBRC 16547]
MGRAFTRSAALIGVTGHILDIEADAGAGPPELHLIGLPERSVWPARDRIRAAILNSGIAWPDARVTLSVCPDAMPVYDSAADLALAVAFLAATGHVPPERLAGTVFLGELGLNGGIRPVRGVLLAIRAAAAARLNTVVVPAFFTEITAQVPDAAVIPAARLSDVIAWLRDGTTHGDAVEAEPVVVTPPAVDLADVPGNRTARRALEVCAAGGHHLLLRGEGPGTMLAERLPGLLPLLDGTAAQEVADIYSLAGRHDRMPGSMPPLCAPHHTSTPAAIFGSVAANRPGAVSLAHRGVLHLADAPEFPGVILDGLCRPMDSGEILLAGMGRSVRYPARFLLVVDASDCPCADRRSCSCSPGVRRRYLGRLTALMPRIEVRARTEPIARPAQPGESTLVVAARVREARERAAARLAGTPWRTNAEIPALELRTRFPSEPEAVELLRSAVHTGVLTDAALPRLLRVAWTIADLRGVDRPAEHDAAGALDLWKGAINGEGR